MMASTDRLAPRGSGGGYASGGEPAPGVATPETDTREETKLYPRYKVFVHNDDVTPMALVVHVLTGIFGLELARAHDVMMEAHNTGVAFVIALTLEQAEFRVDQAHSLARGAHYPLTFTYEPE